MAIQLILICLVVLIGVFFLKNREAMRTKAIVKLLFLLFIGFSIFTVLNPDTLSTVANRIGVGRGADLLLYSLFIAYVFSMIYFYLELKKADAAKSELARTTAILRKKIEDIEKKS